MTYIVEAGPFNGPDDDDSVMNWVDISPWVNDKLSPIATASGRQTELQAVNVGTFGCVLNNGDHRFTSGNPTSPYYPGWDTAMRIRTRETVGNVTVTLFDGNMLQPDLNINLPNVDQTVTVSAVDRIARLGTARKFVTTFTEYVIAHAGTSLKAHWPLADPAGSIVAAAAPNFAVTTNLVANPYFEAPLGQSAWDFANNASIAANSGQAHEGAQSLLVTPDGVTAVPQAQSDEVPARAGRSYTLSGWVRSAAGGDTLNLAVFWFDAGHTFLSAGQISAVPAAGVWTLYGPTTFTAPAGTAFATVVSNNPGTPAASHTWRLDEVTLTEFVMGPLIVEGRFAGVPANPGDLLTFGAMDFTPGDDGRYPQFKPVLNATSSGVASSNRLVNRNLGAIPMTAAINAFFTICGWVWLDPTNTGGYQVLLAHDNAFVNTLQISAAGPGGQWNLAVINAAGSASINGPFPSYGKWQFVAARLNNSTGAAELWVDGTVATGTTGGASAGTMDVAIVDCGSPGQSVAQVQIYAGPSAGFDLAAYTAQRTAAYTGLTGQFAGERINTLALYAGMSPADLDIDQGTAVMQVAALAGKTPLEAMQTAADTDLGLLHARGRTLVFHSRKRRYDL